MPERIFFPFSIKSTCSADSVTDRANLRDWNDTLPPFGRLENAKFVPSLLYNSVFSHFVCYGYQVQIYIFFFYKQKKTKKKFKLQREETINMATRHAASPQAGMAGMGAMQHKGKQFRSCFPNIYRARRK